MLTYQYRTSIRVHGPCFIALLLVFFGSENNPEESEQTHGYFYYFIIGKGLSEFFLVNGLEMVDSLTAQLLWCCHVSLVLQTS
jgi:hypothetical protein